MSKNAEGWIRHRGGKCPVEAGVLVDVRYRDGDIHHGIKSLASPGAERDNWIHEADRESSAADCDIMAYRLHKPAEQPYVRDERDIASDPDGILIVNPYDTLKAYKPAEQVEACSKPKVYSGTLQSLEVIEREGPLQWRDRINEIDVEVQARTVERTELVQKLASEGFALIGRVVEPVEPVEDMSDWRNWKVGDRIEVISNGFDGRDIGEMLTVDGMDSDDNDQPVGVMGDDGTHSWPMFSDDHFSCIKFHSRPSA